MAGRGELESSRSSSRRSRGRAAATPWLQRAACSAERAGPQTMPPAATPPAAPPALALGAAATARPPSSSSASGTAAGESLSTRGADAETVRDPAEPSDNDDTEPPVPVWSTSSLTETIADLRKGLAQLQHATASSTTTTVAQTDAQRSTAAQATTTTARMTSTRSQSRGGAQVTAADTTRSLFKVQPRFAMPVSPPSLPSTATADTVRRVVPDADADKRAAQQTRGNGLATSLTARRLVQLPGPAWPVGYQTAPAGSVTWSFDGVARPHGVSPGITLIGGGPVGPNPVGAPNMTGYVGQRGSVTGTLAGSLHGGVNVLLGGAMLSGLILLVFFICYCCQRSARKSDAQFRTQYWLPDPDGPLEVFTLDAQSQRLERAGAVLLPTEQLEAFVASPSPPPAYHTVVNLPPVCKPPGEAPAHAGRLSRPTSASSTASDCAPATDILVKLPPSATCGPGRGLGRGLGRGEVDADGLPSYEAALKIESQGHI